MPDVLGRVAELWRYPASSLGGERLETMLVEPLGVLGDRLYGLVNARTGEIARPKDPEWHAVVQIRARLSALGGLEIATPNGSWLAAPSPEASEAVSAFLGFDAEIRPLSGEGASGDGPEAVARYTKAPIHLLTTASQARLKALHPAGDPDQRRFRPNILVEMPEQPDHFPETEWIGRRLVIGDLRLTIAEPCKRCGFTMVAQDGFGYDPEILRSLVRNNRSNIGVYCTVDRSAEIAVGADTRFLD